MTAGTSIGIERAEIGATTRKTGRDSVRNKERRSARRTSSGKKKNSVRQKKWPKKSR
jgi:hypothetical protein